MTELFRFTTAEPTPDGIFWKAEADITDYHNLFLEKNQSIYSWLPNYVTDIYT
eukprot:Pgem_evm1s12603